MKKITLIAFVLSFAFLSCKKSDTTPDPQPPGPSPAAVYFPPLSGSEWASVTPTSLSWNTSAMADLNSYLESKGTKAFVILKNGKMVVENYYGTFKVDSFWYWASAGKTMTAMLVGIAQKEGLLQISDKTSKYLGNGWTSLSQAKEDMITIRHQLTMTTGLDDAVQPDNDCTSPACLQYKADAGTRWAYHNAPYTLLDKVVEAASGTTYNNFFQQKIRDRIGMNGLWIKTGFNNVYYSNPRSMARFGLLLMNKGKWDQTQILNDTLYHSAQINSSQNLNPSYGLLTWLNGKSSYMLPGLQLSIPGKLIPNAPDDCYAALGKNDQKIYVVPSQGLVVIRMGEAANESKFALSSFDNELWGKLKLLIGY